MNKYIYEGPIVVFDKCLKNVWKSETVAVNDKKAKSNLLHQARKVCNLVPNTKISLPGNLYLMRGGVD